LLKNGRIITIIESKVERWFEDADINTTITIVEKCDNGDKRNENLVKFVQFKKLEDIVTTTNKEGGWKAVDELGKKIEHTKYFYEDGNIRIKTLEVVRPVAYQFEDKSNFYSVEYF